MPGAAEKQYIGHTMTIKDAIRSYRAPGSLQMSIAVVRYPKLSTDSKSQLKVCTILDELQLPSKLHYKELTETNGDDYLEMKPNIQLPAITDPKSGLTLWEESDDILPALHG
ncbi:hypothetical protein P171DRAFT_441309 [Karstenula rhodostoma CBS 690.94]|uniref:GST N-terminal domain-containing protein n=1 Tax=Karstenula rhodostoma CBS 690.94 TaxID=1392251 RepID=A0A9P4PTL1_9PLEO|nr:hypothetical protein P171DRAFT_441309 [Karstenula rhodostoma CBS 690.94]